MKKNWIKIYWSKTIDAKNPLETNGLENNLIWAQGQFFLKVVKTNIIGLSCHIYIFRFIHLKKQLNLKIFFKNEKIDWPSALYASLSNHFKLTIAKILV